MLALQAVGDGEGAEERQQSEDDSARHFPGFEDVPSCQGLSERPQTQAGVTRGGVPAYRRIAPN